MYYNDGFSGNANLNCRFNSYYDISIIESTSFSSALTATNSDGSLFDLTNYSVSGSLEDKTGGILANFNINIPSPSTSGVVLFGLGADQTSGLPVGKSKYYILATTTGDSAIRLLNGYASIYPL